MKLRRNQNVSTWKMSNVHVEIWGFLRGCRTKRVTRCRDARSVRPLYQRLQHRDFNGDGRSDRASLQRVTRLAVIQYICYSGLWVKLSC